MSESVVCDSSEKAMEVAGGSHQTDLRDQNIVTQTTVTAQVERNCRVMSPQQHRQPQPQQHRRESTRVENRPNNTERTRSNLSCYVSEPRRKKFANICCMFGVIGIATGTGLILIYIIGEYSSIFGEISNLKAVSIPGFVFLFMGIFTSVIGIFFCWIYTADSASRICRDEEMNAGFHLPGHRRHNGYENPALSTDLPPAYITVARSRSFITSLSERTDDSLQKPPSYTDATTSKQEEEDKPVCEDVQEQSDPSEPPPPPY